jgi:uncharacterized RmlC-like cupin family protein
LRHDDAVELLRYFVAIVWSEPNGTWNGGRLEQHLSAQAVNFIYIPFLIRPEMVRFRW